MCQDEMPLEMQCVEHQLGPAVRRLRLEVGPSAFRHTAIRLQAAPTTPQLKAPIDTFLFLSRNASPVQLALLSRFSIAGRGAS
jgi:hypothetical protein